MTAFRLGGVVCGQRRRRPDPARIVAHSRHHCSGIGSGWGIGTRWANTADAGSRCGEVEPWPVVSPAMLKHARVVLVGVVFAVVVLPASSAGAVAGYGDVAEGRYFTDPVQWSVDGDNPRLPTPKPTLKNPNPWVHKFPMS